MRVLKFWNIFVAFKPFKQKCGKVNDILSFSVASVSRLMHLSMPPPPPPLMWLVYPSDLDITETKSVISRAKAIILCRNFPKEGGWRALTPGSECSVNSRGLG